MHVSRSATRQGLSRVASASSIRLTPLAAPPSLPQRNGASSAAASAASSPLHASAAANVAVSLSPIAVAAAPHPLTIAEDEPFSLDSFSSGLQSSGPPFFASGLPSVHAPTSLDEYVALQSQQSTRGLEVVYGLKVELSRFYEELQERGRARAAAQAVALGGGWQMDAAAAEVECGWGPPLPYRVEGEGGVLWWKKRREQYERRNASNRDAAAPSDENSDGEGVTDDAGDSRQVSDPFGTGLESDLDVPPPVSPESILPAYVLLDLLRTATRAALADYEDESATMRARLQQAVEVEEQLHARLDAARDEIAALQSALAAANAHSAAAGGMVVSSPRSAFMRRPTTTGAKRVHYADSGREGSIPSSAREPSSASPIPSPPLSPSARAASPLPSELKSPRDRDATAGAAPPRLNRGTSLVAAAEALYHRNSTNSVAARVYNQDVRGVSRVGSEWNLNSPREEQLERKVVAMELALQAEKTNGAKLRAQIQSMEASHAQEIKELHGKLQATTSQFHGLQSALTQARVQLNLESIARRQRDAAREAAEQHFASEMREWEREVKELLHPRRDRLVVRQERTFSQELAAKQKAEAEQRTGKTGRSNSAKKRNGGGSVVPGTPALAPVAEGEAKDNAASVSVSSTTTLVVPSSTALVLAPSSGTQTPSLAGVGSPTAGDELYPSASSPLTMLEKGVKTPGAKQWLGRLLNSASVVESASGTPAAVDKTPLNGHLVAGVDVLAGDMLLLLERLFQTEYAHYARASAELSRNLQWQRALDERRQEIRDSDVRLDWDPDPPPLQLNSQPSGVELAALLASLTPAALAYLQSIQRLFLAIYSRMPASVQQRFQDLSASMKRVPDLNDKGSRAKAADAPSGLGSTLLSVAPSALQSALPSAPASVQPSPPGSPRSRSPQRASLLAPAVPAVNVLSGSGPSPSPRGLSQEVLDASFRAHRSPGAGAGAGEQASRTPALLSSGFNSPLPAGAASVAGRSANMPHDRSFYLARFELLLSKIQALASVRGVVLHSA